MCVLVAWVTDSVQAYAGVYLIVCVYVCVCVYIYNKWIYVKL